MLEIFIKASDLLSHDDVVGTYGLCYRNNVSGIFGKTITGVFFIIISHRYPSAILITMQGLMGEKSYKCMA